MVSPYRNRRRNQLLKEDNVSTNRVTDRFRHGLGSLAVAAAVGALVVGGVAGAGQVAAQDASPVPNLMGPATVSVSGHGSVNVVPDTAQITIGVDVTLPTLEEAQAESERQSSAIIESIKANGVADDDVQTSNYSVFVVRNYDQNGTPSEIIGYQITNQVNVTIRDVESVGQILTAAIEAGANNIWGISFFVDDQTAAASEARVLAVEDARRKAEELAAASGMSLGRVLAISEGTQAPQFPVMYGGAGQRAGDISAAAPIEAGTNEVVVDVQVVYELVGE
jgi:uncharacterized protein YggE